MTRKFFTILALLLTATRSLAVDGAELSRRFDRLYRADSSEAVAAMTVKTADYSRTLKMRMWSKDLDNVLIRILEPPKERGTATLKRGNEMWNYLPKIDKTLRIPPSMMMSSWMGSDLTNDDLVRHTSWERDYLITEIPRPGPGLVGLTYTPKPDAAVTWSKIDAWFDEKTALPDHLEFFDEKGRKVRLMEFLEVGDLGGRLLPKKLTVRPLDEEKRGNVTEIRYEKLSFDVKIPADFFSQTSLRKER